MNTSQSQYIPVKHKSKPERYTEFMQQYDVQPDEA